MMVSFSSSLTAPVALDFIKENILLQLTFPFLKGLTFGITTPIVQRMLRANATCLKIRESPNAVRVFAEPEMST